MLNKCQIIGPYIPVDVSTDIVARAKVLHEHFSERAQTTSIVHCDEFPEKVAQTSQSHVHVVDRLCELMPAYPTSTNWRDWLSYLRTCVNYMATPCSIEFEIGQ